MLGFNHWRVNRRELPLSDNRRETAEPVAGQRESMGSGHTGKTAGQFKEMAQASVQLAALGPHLAKLAAEMETEAKNQADRTAAIRTVLDEFTHDLESAVQELRCSSGEVGKAVDTVSHIAKHTGIISINAGIEAVRAGESGRAFGVIVDEVQRLAEKIDRTTGLITQSIDQMQQSIVRIAAVANRESNTPADLTNNTVGAVIGNINGILESVDGQLDGARMLHRTGNRVSGYTEDLLLALGTFRFDAHKRAEREVAEMVSSFDGIMGNKRLCEKVIEQWMLAHTSFELAYVTDAGGRQFVDNIARRDGKIVHDKEGNGQDWSKRPWCANALRHEGFRSTDIYRSSATGDFCFTVTATLRDSRKTVLGVLAADVNFQRLLG